jgi:hypothetical protein
VGVARRYEDRSGHEALAHLQRQMFATVDEIDRFLTEHEIDAGYVRSGQLGYRVR